MMKFQPKVLMTILMASLMMTGGTAHAVNQFYFGERYVQNEDLSSLYETCMERCPSISYELVDTGLGWLDDIINKDVISAIDVLEDDPDKHQYFYQKTHVTDNDLARQLYRIHDNIIRQSNEAYEADAISSYSVDAHPRLTGVHQGLVLMEMGTDVYLGGAHNVPQHHYYVFDLTAKKQLGLDDVLTAGQKQRFERLALQKFRDYLIEMEVDPNEHMATWEFALTDNFTFNKDGLELLYQPYELGPYAMGMVYLNFSYDELQGLMKTKYLPAKPR